MANVTTPASFSYTGGSIRSTRIKPARFRYTAGSFVSSKDSSTSGAATVPDLDRLTRFDRLTEGDQVTARFQFIWQQTMEAIEEAFEAVNQRVDDNSAILARLTAAEAKAEAANDNANAAKVTADAVKVAAKETFDTVSAGSGTTFNERIADLAPGEEIP